MMHVMMPMNRLTSYLAVELKEFKQEAGDDASDDANEQVDKLRCC